ncbi:alpha-amylase family glycosyl hydrolase [Microbacterium sp. BDGP8]|uniref:alpha-amylase family glycosyl hydrolase n=1 Tax=Microbacterium sp. BDGP8 TaxID=3035531 RepID=UPI00249ECA32|nr:alpha-amylase family glycosyl hydrolase [Microbacterium sp. BDGP8]WHE35091.1 alpha-amylase family glycosyl hydrolase [Microbacterium sp. BDGP8]
MSNWAETVMLWHVYPLGFTGAPIRPDGADDDGQSNAGAADQPVEHRLSRIEDWLDHVVELGLNGLLLGPVFPSSTHGYDTVDYFRIDARLGDDGDIDRLIAAAHDRGIRVLFDGVFNHVGREHPAFAALEEQGPEADTADLFRVRWDGWQPGEPIDADVFEGHDALVTLNHDSPAVADLVVEVMTHWLGRGIDGWRLDAAYAVPSAFWARVLPRVRAEYPEAWFLGEVIHGDAARIVEESTIDSLTQYELWQGIWHGIADRNLFELKHAIERNNELLSVFAPQTFVGNHDVTRIASAIGPDLVPHALAVLFTVAGVPSVYAGDEYGYEAVKEERLGGDDAVRPEFPDAPPAPESLPETAQHILRTHQQLIAVRRQHPWLRRAHTDVIHIDNTAMVLRTATGTDAVVTALNVGDAPVSVPVADATRLLAGSLADDIDRHAGEASLPPRGWAVLSATPA